MNRINKRFTMKEKKDIFISYRRAGGEWFAYCIYSELISAGYSVFLDVVSLRSGNFEEAIVEQILTCKDFILVLPPNALNRCVEAEDLVYKEIKTAKENGKNIIPLVMENFLLPSRKLFEENNVSERYELLKDLDKQNGYIINGILYFDGVISYLTKKLLISVPSKERQEKEITLEKIFLEYEGNKKKVALEYELLPNITTNEYFVEGSRDKEIAWLSDSIERRQPLFVWGYGGVGKTELVMEFARYQSQYRNVAFVAFSDSIRETIIHMKFAGYKMPNLDRISREERRDVEEKIYCEKLKLLNAYSQDDILIIDNFEKKGKTLAELKQESAYKDIIGIKMHVIFTTRSRPDKHTKELQPLKKEDLLVMMKHYLGDTTISEDTLVQLIDAVDGHTMAVELIAKLLSDEFSCITSERILDAFTKGKVKELADTEVESYKDRELRETTIFEHIKTLFDLATLSKTELMVLRHAFFISAIGMKTDVFIKIGKKHHMVIEKDLSEVQQYDKVVKGLVNKGWLRIKSGRIFIHSLVKEVMREEKIINLDKELSMYLCNFHIPHYISYILLGHEQNGIEERKNVERMKAEYMVNVFQYFDNEIPFFAAEAARAFRYSFEYEQSIIYSHYALDIMVSNKKKNGSIVYNDFLALEILNDMWCPKLVESLWDPDCFYGNELQEDYYDLPDNVQNIYYKMQLLHDIHPVNPKKRYIELSEDGTVLKKFNYFTDTEYIIPDSVVEIADEAFEKCIHLKNVVMPDSVVKIGKDVFCGCENLEKIKLSKKIKKLPYGTFCGCKNLKKIIVPDTVEVIGVDAFVGCVNLESIKMSKKLHTIESSAFENCLAIERIELSESLKYLGQNAFKGCEKMKEILIPDGLEVIGDGAFDFCINLKKVNLPRNLKKISPIAFQNSSVECITIEKENDSYYSEWGSLFTKDRKTMICCPPANSVFKVFDETEEIGDFACQKNVMITTVEIPRNVRRLGKASFASCRSLAMVSFENGLEIIDDFCFNMCDKLKKLILPDSLKQIGESVFENCYGLFMVKLPNHLEKIGKRIFRRCYCLENLKLPDNIKVVPVELCSECYALKEVSLAKGTTEIRFNAFANCVNLKHVKNTNTVKRVETTIFQNCINLDIPQFASHCLNGFNLDFTSVEDLCENSEKLMLGFDKNNMEEWKKEEIKNIKKFAETIIGHTK